MSRADRTCDVFWVITCSWPQFGSSCCSNSRWKFNAVCDNLHLCCLRDNHARLAVRKSDSNSVEWNSCYRYIKQHNSFYGQPVYGDFQSCSLLSLNYSVQLRLPTYHDILALPAFARRCCSNRWISPAGRAHSSKPVAAGLLLWAHAGTNGRMDTVPFHRPRFAYYAGSANTLEELWIDRLQAAIIWCYRWPQTTELALFAKYCFFPLNTLFLTILW